MYVRESILQCLILKYLLNKWRANVHEQKWKLSMHATWENDEETACLIGIINLDNELFTL